MAKVPTLDLWADAPLGEVVRYFPGFWEELRSTGFWDEVSKRSPVPWKAGPATISGRVATGEISIGPYTLNTEITFTAKGARTRVLVEGDLKGFGSSMMVRMFASDPSLLKDLGEAFQERIVGYIAAQKAAERERGGIAV